MSIYASGVVGENLVPSLFGRKFRRCVHRSCDIRIGLRRFDQRHSGRI